MLPNFLGIGAPRSGTTWLYYNFRQHPEIWLPPVKEIHYFDELELGPLPNLFDRIISRGNEKSIQRWKRYLKNHKNGIKKSFKTLDIPTFLWYCSYFFSLKRDIYWYKSIFRQSNNRLSGDITPNYGHLTVESVERVKNLMPEAKIIFLMRDPVVRAWSSVVKTIISPENIKTIDSKTEKRLINYLHLPHSIKANSYLKNIETWKSFYPEEQVFIGFYDEIVDSPERLLKRIYDFFLGVDSSSEFIDNKKMKKKVNSYGDTKNIPKNIARNLAELHWELIEELHNVYGGYATCWFENAKKMLD